MIYYSYALFIISKRVLQLFPQNNTKIQILLKLILETTKGWVKCTILRR